MHINTFSMVAHDPEENAWGVVVASKFLAVGSLVSWAQAGAGAVATQAYARVSYGPDGLRAMAEGRSAADVLHALLESDPQRETRQVGLVDAEGRSAAFTGSKCHDYAGHRTGQGFSAQGNLLAGPAVLDAMVDAYKGSRGELADRLMSALMAGDGAGGDKRGRQSAALLVVRPVGGYGGDNDLYLDLRVDDDPDPITRLKQLIKVHRLYFGVSKPEDRLPIDGDIARELQAILLKQGYMGGEITGDWDAMTQQAFWVMVGDENLESRWNMDDNPDQIDKVALDYLRQRFG